MNGHPPDAGRDDAIRRRRLSRLAAALGVCIIAVVIVVVIAAAKEKNAEYRDADGARDAGCILLISGNKLCGEDAVAWCDGTDQLRSDVAGAEAGQETCDRLRSGG